MGIMDIFRQIETGKNTNIHGKLSWLIVGLGNPGMEYAATRHNAGFMAVEQLAALCDIKLDRMQFQANCGEAMLSQVRCLLMKPATFMNRSGDAIGKAVNFYKIPPEQVLVLYDDISLAPGKLRIRQKGSAGGHNGMKSIIAQLGTEQFPRIRIGVGAKPNPNYDLADWVLSKFTDEEQKQLELALKNAAEAAKLVVEGNVSEAMNRYN